MPAVVIAMGPNSVQIPVLFYGTAQEAVDDLIGKGFHAKGLDGNPIDMSHPDNAAEDGELAWFDHYQGVHLEDAFRQRDEPEGAAAAIFADGAYYGGCGDASSLVVKNVQLGKPIVGWDLD